MLGWLLTPAVVWAASFLGGWLGAVISGKLVYLVVGGVVGGAGGLAGWIWVMRRGVPISATATSGKTDD